MAKVVSSPTLNAPRLDLAPEFTKSEFDSLITKYGQYVVFERALQCPCKSSSTNQLTNCRNCGGSGWLFLFPVQTKMVIEGLKFNETLTGWSNELKGTVKISAGPADELCYMDRITVVNSKGVFTEALDLRYDEDAQEWFVYTTYNVGRLLTVGLFQSMNQPLQNIGTSNVTVDGNLLIFKPGVITVPVDDTPTVTLRYEHPPQFYIEELKRESMQSFQIVNGEEVQIMLPIHAIGRRAHYILDSSRLNGQKVLKQDLSMLDCKAKGLVEDL